MREIKLRAWDLEDKYWVEDWVVSSYGCILDLLKELFRGHKDYILMQFTGLLDKNGVEIYEGDVVYLAGYGNYVVEWPFIQLFQSSWEKDVGQIIGNIYENPELLED